MKRIFLLLSVLLLFIGMTLANAPPAFDVGLSQTEFINYLPGDHLDLTGVEMDVIQFTAEMQASYLSAHSESTNTQNLTIPEVVDTGPDLLDENLCKIQKWNNLLVDGLITSADYTFLIESQNDLLIMYNLYSEGLSRLDIGENHTT